MTKYDELCSNYLEPNEFYVNIFRNIILNLNSELGIPFNKIYLITGFCFGLPPSYETIMLKRDSLERCIQRGEEGYWKLKTRISFVKIKPVKSIDIPLEIMLKATGQGILSDLSVVICVNNIFPQQLSLKVAYIDYKGICECISKELSCYHS